jgi:hypothetical protein
MRRLLRKDVLEGRPMRALQELSDIQAHPTRPAAAMTTSSMMWRDDEA